MGWILLGLTSFLAVVWGLEEYGRRKAKRENPSLQER